jgi:hypothetical protein
VTQFEHEMVIDSSFFPSPVAWFNGVCEGFIIKYLTKQYLQNNNKSKVKTKVGPKSKAFELLIEVAKPPSMRQVGCLDS